MLVLITTTRPPTIRTRSLKGPRAKSLPAPGLTASPTLPVRKGSPWDHSHSIVVRWRNYFSQLFNVHGVKEVGRAEIHTAEPLVPDPSASELELAFDKLESHKSPGIDQIPAELIKVGEGG